MNTDRALSALCLARKAGRLVCGTEQCLDAVRNKKACLLLVSSDVSPQTLKQITDKASFYGVAVEHTSYTRAVLGAAFGMAECACAALCGTDFVKMYSQAKNKQSEVN